MQKDPTLPPARVEHWQWQLAAACRGEESKAFFDDTSSANESAAKEICGRCPVVAQCREYAIDAEEPYGIWGGLAPDERVREQWNRPPRRRRLKLFAAGVGWAAGQ